MKLGLDLDSTITAAPGAFSALARSVKESGGTVHIIHGADKPGPTDQAVAKARLAQCGMDGLYDSLDIASKPIAKSKAAIAGRLGLDMFIDNRKKNAKRVGQAGIASAHFFPNP